MYLNHLVLISTSHLVSLSSTLTPWAALSFSAHTINVHRLNIICAFGFVPKNGIAPLLYDPSVSS